MGVLTRRGIPSVTGHEWQGVSYFCSLRGNPEPRGANGTQGAGVSLAPYDSFNLGDHVGDEPGAVQANRDSLADALPSAPIWLNQVHGTEVFDADAAAPRAGAGAGKPVCSGAPPVADAAVTSTPGRVLCIMTADCLPVVLSDSAGSVLGVAHAGWRGLAAGVLENTLAAMRRRVGAGSGWRAWIGPAIGQAAFEVGAEVREAFVRHDADAALFFLPGRQDRWQGDLAGLAAHRLRRAGVRQVQDSGLCTYDRPELFYSYRRDGRTGRMATVAWLDGGI